jgi:hypothetical protein
MRAIVLAVLFLSAAIVTDSVYGQCCGSKVVSSAPSYVSAPSYSNCCPQASCAPVANCSTCVPCDNTRRFALRRPRTENNCYTCSTPVTCTTGCSTCAVPTAYTSACNTCAAPAQVPVQYAANCQGCNNCGTCNPCGAYASTGMVAPQGMIATSGCGTHCNTCVNSAPMYGTYTGFGGYYSAPNYVMPTSTYPVRCGCN